MNRQKYLTKTETAERYGKSVRTIDKWLADARMAFPRPFIIRGRPYFVVDGDDGLDAWDCRQIKAAAAEQVAA